MADAPTGPADPAAARVTVKVAEMRADLAAVDSVEAMFAAIERHRVARDWLRRHRPEIGRGLDADFRAEYEKWMGA